VQALAFDFDGLILDTESAELQVWQEEFRSNGVEMPPNYWTQVIGRGAEQAIERPPQLLARLAPGFEETPEKAAKRRERIIALIEKETARPGIESLVEEAIANGVPLGVASSSRHQWVDYYLKKLNLWDRFQVVVCADDVTHAKPFPDLYLELCRRLHAAPTQSVALEDSPNGLAAAVAAQMFAVVVPNSVTSQLDISHADLRIDDLSKWSLAQLDERLRKARPER
jgi:HAD superfamily hydrolase (TIGR01509 family)